MDRQRGSNQLFFLSFFSIAFDGKNASETYQIGNE